MRVLKLDLFLPTNEESRLVICFDCCCYELELIRDERKAEKLYLSRTRLKYPSEAACCLMLPRRLMQVIAWFLHLL